MSICEKAFCLKHARRSRTPSLIIGGRSIHGPIGHFQHDNSPRADVIRIGTHSLPSSNATLRILLFACRCSHVHCGNIAAAAPPTKPNVILFLVDDMGWMDSTPYGSQYYETPVMQCFASQAMRFTDAYARPLCSPTRASILTSQYSSRHGITTASGHQPPQPPGHNFMPSKHSPKKAMIYPESKNYLEPSQEHVGRVRCETRDGEGYTSVNGTSGWPKSIGPSDKGSRWRCTGRRTGAKQLFPPLGPHHQTSQRAHLPMVRQASTSPIG